MHTHDSVKSGMQSCLQPYRICLYVGFCEERVLSTARSRHAVCFPHSLILHARQHMSLNMHD